MIFAGVSCVKNESDIIEPFIRHNLVYLDRMIVMDHGSTDETPAILRALQREGLALDILNDDSLGKFQGEKMTLLMHHAAQSGARWIFLLDADEFIKCPSKTLTPPESVGSGVWQLPCQTYTVTGHDDANEPNPVLRIRHRLKSEPFENGSLNERKLLTKCLVHGDIALDPESRTFQGNHQITVGGREIKATMWDGCRLAHYSMRSPGQYASKISIGVMQHFSRGDIISPIDSFYVKHLEVIRKNFDRFSEDFSSYLPSYMENADCPKEKVLDPLIYHGEALLYTPRISDAARLAGNLINYTEILARTIGSQPQAKPSRTEHALLKLWHSHSSEPVSTKIPCTWANPTLETRVMDLKNWDGTGSLYLELSGPAGFVDIQCLRLRRIDGSAVEISGSQLRTMVANVDNLYTFFHHQYFSFLKGIEPARIVFDPGQTSLQSPWRELELDARFDTNPATIGLRFAQTNPIDARQRIRNLEAKVTQLVSFRGFWKHQFDWICSLVFSKRDQA